MGIFTDIFHTSGIILLLALVAEAGEYCHDYSNGNTEYCSGYCCSSESDSCCSDWGWIAGVVVGAIVFIAIIGTIIFLLCQKMSAKKSQTVHVQMSNYQQNSYQTSHRHTRRVPNNGQNMFLTNTSGNTVLPPPPPYSQTYNPSPAYPPPPPYPGSPLPPAYNVTPGGNNSYQPPQTQMTSHTHNTGDIAYPPPPVS